MEDLAGFRMHMGVGWTGFVVVLAAICALIYWVRFCQAHESAAKSAVKTASILLLALAAWVPWGSGSLIWALGFCALGDFFLSREGERPFMAGVAAFAAGHLAYVHLFLTHRLARPEAITSGAYWPIYGVLLLLGAIMAIILWRRAGALRWAVLAYIPVILSMGVSVLALPGIGPLNLAFVAAALFLASDLILAFQVFVFHPVGVAARIGPFAVWPTYWLAQFGFYLAFAGIPMK